jgi:hypothetical protein
MADETAPGAAAPTVAPGAAEDLYPIKVRGPDGTLHPFAAGTTQEQISASMTSKYSPSGTLPEAGAATPQAGAVQPYNQQVPSYMTPEDWRNIMATAFLGQKSRGIGSVIQGTPGHTYRVELAKKVADEVDRRQNSQYAGSQILKSYAQLLDRFNNTSEEDLKGAIGPYNTKPFKDWIPLVGGMTAPEAKAAYTPSIASKGVESAWNAQNLFGHDVHGVVNALVTNAGKGLNMTDARQAMFESTMRDFMKSTNRASAAEILDHAKHIIANDFGLPMSTANGIVNQYIKDMQRSRQTAAAQGAAPTGGGPGAAGAGPHRERVKNTRTGEMETLEWDGKSWKKVLQ